MFLILLISGIAVIPQAQSLKCNHSICSIDEVCTGKEMQCEPEMTNCGAIRNIQYDAKFNRVTDVVYRSCIKADTCHDASFNFGAAQRYYTTQCCDKDMCNSEKVPPPPTRNPAPNGGKCYFCAGNPKCNVTEDCTGDRTFCFTDNKGPDSVYRGCATKSFCVNPPSIIESHAHFVTCCDDDLCNSSGRPSACVLLLITALTTLCFFSK